MKNTLKSETEKKEKSIDGGLGLALLSLLLFMHTEIKIVLYIHLLILILLLSFPRLFYWFSVVWFKASEKMGHVLSILLLTLIYVVVVIPIGFLVRIVNPSALLP